MMDQSVSASVEPGIDLSVCERTSPRSGADRAMRRLLRLPPDGARVSILDAESMFGRSLAVSATRCLLTYVVVPLLAPVVNLAGVAGPILGLTLGTVSMAAIVWSIRRFFAADHRWRWGYATLGGGIFLLLTVQAVIDVAHLLG